MEEALCNLIAQNGAVRYEKHKPTKKKSEYSLLVFVPTHLDDPERWPDKFHVLVEHPALSSSPSITVTRINDKYKGPEGHIEPTRLFLKPKSLRLKQTKLTITLNGKEPISFPADYEFRSYKRGKKVEEHEVAAVHAAQPASRGETGPAYDNQNGDTSVFPYSPAPSSSQGNGATGPSELFPIDLQGETEPASDLPLGSSSKEPSPNRMNQSPEQVHAQLYYKRTTRLIF